MNEAGVREAVIETNIVSKHKVYLGIKRVFDIAIAFIGCLFLLPIGLIIKICNMLSGDFAPVIYSCNRIGLNGKEFKFYKFRSMVPNADEVLFKLLEENKDLALEYKLNKKLENDPRITKIGKIIRKTSIDELPQLINVLKGDMSLIGPRPLLKGELDYYKGNHDKYEKYKPGITGYWACNGRNNINYKERLKLEYYYCDNIGLFLDIKIFFKTIIIIIKRVGAK